MESFREVSISPKIIQRLLPLRNLLRRLVTKMYGCKSACLLPDVMTFDEAINGWTECFITKKITEAIMAVPGFPKSLPETDWPI
jgi:hypothetical protein